MNPVIRKMTTGDIPAAHELDKISFTLPWPERSLRFEVSDNPVARCWVAELNGRLVGMAVFWMIVDEVHIATIATHPEYRRRGVAAGLLKESLVSAYQEGARKAFLEVRAGNEAALAMYRKFGFSVQGKRQHYYKDNGEDAVLMTLDRLDEMLEAR